MDIPRQLAYEASWFDNPFLDTLARLRHAQLLSRQAELKYQIRRSAVLDRWVLRQSRFRHLRHVPPPSPLTPLLIDEVIQDGKIVDLG